MNKNKNKENRSMYLYTALIFVVALLLILVAFFSQTNISKLGKRADELAPTPSAAAQEAPPTSTSAPTSVPYDPDIAKIVNTFPELDKKNQELETKIEVYEKLLAAYTHIVNGNLAEAETKISDIDESSLSEDQKTLYQEINNKINEGKEQ